MRDPHEILGVPRDASPQTIRQAFLRQAKRLHPDHAGSDAQMARLNQAYASLKGRLTRVPAGGEGAARIHRARRRSRPIGSPPRPLSPEALVFVEMCLLPLDRLLCVAVEGLLRALEAPGRPALGPYVGQAARTLEMTGSRLAKAEWPPDLDGVRRRYGEGLRLVSDALVELGGDGPAAVGRAALRQGLALFRAARAEAAGLEA